MEMPPLDNRLPRFPGGLPGLMACLLLTMALFSCGERVLNHDPVVRQFLDEKEYTYEIDPEGDFIVQFPLAEGHFQEVWIRSRVNVYEDQRIREIFSLAHSHQGSLPRALANQLLLDSYQNRFLGSWTVVRSEETDEYLIVFLCKVLADPYFPLFEPALRESAFAAFELNQLFSTMEEE